MLHYTLDAQPQHPPHKEYRFPLLHSAFRFGEYFTENRVYHKHAKLDLNLPVRVATGVCLT